ncbi:hypothetical protein AWB67_06613 [Caballeronia terrestris]|uniref:Glycosyltransferase RgtA/B/C/D-like domain-containing protein n=1 Tax=Caballeronia terrestris TaxID=1226301 RepID=A0A158KSM3_9BURK|nr:hypothetical protein [Caballeronia terrestris]SAL84176.1 hypothetical protein AWB67_06613 [Caballeronia terrestris]
MIKIEKNLSLLFICAAAVFLYAIHRRIGIELPDDAAFFLRYADNAAQGHFWVWNIGEAPVWGASAPFFPLLLVPLITLGVPSVTSIVWASALLSAASLAAMAVLIARRFGFLSAIAFVVLGALDTGTMFYAGTGLETPLTFALISFALFALLERRGEVAIGIAAGLLAIHKMDLIPVGGLLVLAYSWQTRRMPIRSAVLALVIACLWYGFAWWYFGAPVPNSFLTKALHQNDFVNIIDWRWFGSTVYYRFDHWPLSLLALLGLVRLRKGFAPLLLLMLGLLAVHLAAYTVKHPFEPYDWYCMPSLLVLLILASAGVGFIGELLGARGNKRLLVGAVSVLLLLAVIVRYEIDFQRADTLSRQNWLRYVEHDRAEAGRWVDENTPASFRLVTAWGNPAYFSRRYVYDLSFLNRRYEPGDLIEKYRPEILIFQNSEPSTPLTPDQYGPNYTPVRIFDSAFGNGEGNYFFTVYARKDVLPQIRNVTLPLATSCVAEQFCQRYQPLKVSEASATRPVSLPANTVASTTCHIDEINGSAFPSNEKFAAKQSVNLSGWALNGSEKSLPITLYVKLSGAAGTFYAPARSLYARPDVPAALGLPESLKDAGFKAKLDLSAMPAGDYDVAMLVGSKTETQECAQKTLHLSR